MGGGVVNLRVSRGRARITSTTKWVLCFLVIASTRIAAAQESRWTPAAVQYRYGLALEERGDLEGALNAFTTAIRIDPRLAEAYADRGKALLVKGELSRAMLDFDRAVRIQPRSAESYNNRGIARIRTGDLQGAMADFSRAVKLKPNLAEAYTNRGNLRVRTGDPAGALQDLSKAIGLCGKFHADARTVVMSNSRLAHAYMNRGVALYAQEKIEEAIADYDRAIALDPELPEAHYNRGMALSSRGDQEGARASLSKATDLQEKRHRNVRID
jgi:tetratricopeptide (TPR) repeat protein